MSMDRDTSKIRTGGSLQPPTRSSSGSSSLFPAPNSAQRTSRLGIPGNSRERQKVVLSPGHSPLDWANLNSKTPKHVLRGVVESTPPPQYVRVSKDELKNHKTRQDCWTSINGKVFNITPYVDFHPGESMRS